jgi:predicted nucleotidyltransferase
MGWDVKKALNLHFKSNANLKDWLDSPIVYVGDESGIFEGLPEFNTEILRHQYYGQAQKTNKKYIVGNDLRDKKIVKKTLYVIRCNLAWIELTEENRPEVSDEVCQAIARMRQAYSDLAVDEISDGDLELVHNWIGETLDGFSKSKFKAPKRSIDDYNERFQEIIGLK